MYSLHKKIYVNAYLLYYAVCKYPPFGFSAIFVKKLNRNCPDLGIVDVLEMVVPDVALAVGRDGDGRHAWSQVRQYKRFAGLQLARNSTTKVTNPTISHFGSSA